MATRQTLTASFLGTAEFPLPFSYLRVLEHLKPMLTLPPEWMKPDLTHL